MLRRPFLSVALTLAILAGPLMAADAVRVAPPAAAAERAEPLKKLDPFYKQYVLVDGLRIVGSRKVSKRALREAAHLMRKILARRPDVLKRLVKRNVYVGVIAYNELTTDMPECRGMSPWVNKRARGFGGNPLICAEEDLLCFRGNAWHGENIFIHEFAHVVHGALAKLDKRFNTRLKQLHQKTKETGRFRGYGMNNPGEFWAEGVQSWFDCNRRGGLEARGPEGRHICHINTKEQLKKHLPALAKMVDDAFGKNPWVYVPVAKRLDQPHLRGFDPAKAPTFRWPKKVLEAYNRIEAERAKKRKQREKKAKKK